MQQQQKKKERRLLFFDLLTLNRKDLSCHSVFNFEFWLGGEKEIRLLHSRHFLLYALKSKTTKKFTKYFTKNGTIQCQKLREIIEAY